MADYIEEFKSYISFIKKKILRNIINQHISTNLVQLGLLLNHTEFNNPAVKKWLIAFHKACKYSKINMHKSSNNHLITFKLKLTKISSKLFEEMKIVDLHNFYGLIVKDDRYLNLGKIRKLLFMKKISKCIPVNVQRLISDISIYISEAVKEEDINSICINFSNECINVKRKKFTRQIKESLLKYYNDFGNLIDSNEVSQLENNMNELVELRKCLEKFDKISFNRNFSNSLTDIETFLRNENQFTMSDKILMDNETNKAVSTTTTINDIDYYDDFHVIEEWDGCFESNRTLTNLCRETLHEDLTTDFIFAMETINNNLLSDINRTITSCEPQGIFVEAKSSDDFADNEIMSCENQTISNIQKSFLLDFNKEVDKIFIKYKPEQEVMTTENDSCQDFLCNRNIIVNNKSSIKIKNLKNINICSTHKKIKDTESDENFLQNIPLPNKSFNQYNNDSTRLNKIKPPNFLSECKKPFVIEDESDTAEELIPQSILDFSEVLNDEFCGRENKELLSNVVDSIEFDHSDNRKLQINSSPDLYELQTMESIDNKENIPLNLRFCNYDAENCTSDLCNKEMNSSLDQYMRPSSSVYKSNYSMLNIDEASEGYYNKVQHYPREIIENCLNLNKRDYDYCSENQSRYSYYYNSYYSNYPYRQNRRLLRNFSRYRCQSNNSQKRRFN